MRPESARVSTPHSSGGRRGCKANSNGIRRLIYSSNPRSTPVRSPDKISGTLVMPRFGRQRDSRVINLRLVPQGLVRAISWHVSSLESLSPRSLSPFASRSNYGFRASERDLWHFFPLSRERSSLWIASLDRGSVSFYECIVRWSVEERNWSRDLDASPRCWHLHCSMSLIADLHGLRESSTSLIAAAVLRELWGIFSRSRSNNVTVLRLIDLFSLVNSSSLAAGN